MIRRRVILRCFLSFVGSIAFLCMFFVTYLKIAWLGWVVAPACFLPAVVVAAILSQRLDKESKEAFWIGVPTIFAMGLMVAFAFFMFSSAGERFLVVPVAALAAVIAVATLDTIAFLMALRLSRRRLPR